MKSTLVLVFFSNELFFSNFLNIILINIFKISIIVLGFTEDLVYLTLNYLIIIASSIKII